MWSISAQIPAFLSLISVTNQCNFHGGVDESCGYTFGKSIYKGAADKPFFIFLTSLVTKKFVFLQKVWREVHEKGSTTIESPSSFRPSKFSVFFITDD